MEKSKLQSFINRYYLAGNCEAVTVKANGQSVNCELIDVDQTVVGKVKWKTDPFMSGELGINHTGALTKMLSDEKKKSFQENVDRVWLHTCSLDHKNALYNYLARGMKIFKSEIVRI